MHKGRFLVDQLPAGDPRALDGPARETVDAVLDYYGDRHSQWLSDLTHMEPPWRDAYGDTPPGRRCSREIPLSAMAEYYESLPPED